MGTAAATAQCRGHAVPRHKQVVDIAHRPAMLAAAWEQVAAVVPFAATMEIVAAMVAVATGPQTATQSLHPATQTVCQRAGARIVRVLRASVAIEVVDDDAQDATELRIVKTDQPSSLVPWTPEQVRLVVTSIADSP